MLAAAVGLQLRAGAVASARPARGEVDEIALDLASRVEQRWRQEAARRGLTRPVPMRVRWASTSRPVAADRDVVMDDPGSTWHEMPLKGDISQIVAAYRMLPRRQLVVLGEPGGGKTAASLLLTLGLLEDRSPGEPVPVLLALASWSPTNETAQHYIIRRVVEDYGPWAGGDEQGVATVEALCHGRMIVPILDGLDEVDAAAHPQAIEALDELAGAGVALVVTCRTGEYERAVARSETVLSAAAVVELTRVRLDDLIAYLSRPEPARARWKPVFAHLRANPNGSLARILSTPLMTTLARVAYRDAGTDPGDLLAAEQRAMVTATLFDAFLTAAYQPGASGGSDSRVRLRRYRPDRAMRWLETVAYILYRAGARDLWWWQLDRALLARRPRLLASALAAARHGSVAVIGLFAGLVAGGVDGAFAGSAAGLLIATVPAVGRSRWFDHPGAGRLTPDRGRRREWLGTAATSILLASAVGLLLLGVGMEAAATFMVSLAAGAITMLVPAVMPIRSAGLGRRGGIQRAMVAGLRRLSLLIAVRYLLVASVVYTMVAASFSVTGGDLVKVGLAAAAVYGTASVVGIGWPWMRFRAHHLVLAVAGNLPWRLWPFLEDACIRQVARNAGPAWQFRHALLQDRLAERARGRLLRRLADAGNRNAARALARLLHEQGNPDEAIAILRHHAETGDWNAAWTLADLLGAQGSLDELRRRAEAGSWNAARELADRLREQGDVDELRKHAEAGNPHAAHRLADLLREQGNPDEAIAILRHHADAGNRNAAWTLARLLREQGNPDEAIAILRRNAEAGDEFAAGELADLLRAQGTPDEAIAILRHSAEAGNRRAASALAGLLGEHGKLDELRQRADAGDRDAAWVLAKQLREQGNRDEAITILRHHAEADDVNAARELADLLHEQGNLDELRRHAEAGSPYAAHRLADLLRAQGTPDEAIAILRRSAESGNWRAASALADLLGEQGKLDELRQRADAGDWNAAWVLAKQLREQGNRDEAITILRHQVENGNPLAAIELADLLHDQGNLDELRRRANAGDPYAASQAARLLRERGSLDEAVMILRRHADAGSWEAERELPELLREQGNREELRRRADAGNQHAIRKLAELLHERGILDENPL
jgi:thioredoxin-like negative regulator of GroEL